MRRFNIFITALGALHVGGNVQRTQQNGLVIDAPKSENSRRTIAIDSALTAELRKHKAAQAALGLQIGIAQHDDWLLFPESPDRPTEPRSPNGFAQALARRLERTRFKGVMPHALRHAHATALLADRESPKLVAKRLAHTVEELLKTYAHVIDQDAASAAEKFAARVSRSGSGIPGAPGEDSAQTDKVLKIQR